MKKENTQDVVLGYVINFDPTKSCPEMYQVFEAPLSCPLDTAAFRSLCKTASDKEVLMEVRRSAFAMVATCTFEDAKKEFEKKGSITDNTRCILHWLLSLASSEHHIMGEAPMTDLVDFIIKSHITIC